MQITNGKISKPLRVVIYGQEGIGKTTLASQFPNPVFIDTEGGSNHINVNRTPTPTSFGMILAQVAELTRKSHGYQTLVIDTADWMERLAAAQVCAEHGKKGIEDFGYGKGYVYVGEVIGKLLDALTMLRDAGMNVILVAHATTRKFELPEEEGTFDRYEMKLSRHSAALIREWADLILFCRFKTYVVVDPKTQRGKAQGSERVMQSAHSAAWDAKNRLGLPEEMPFGFAALAPHFSAPAQAATPAAKPVAPQPMMPAAPPATMPETMLPQDPSLTIEPQALSPAHRRLRDAMAASEITETQLRLAIENHPRFGTIFPKDMIVDNYPDDFLDKSILPVWGRVAEKAKEYPAQ